MAGLMLTLALGMLLPVYTDELGWRFQERAWVDGVDKMFSDLCGPNTLAVPPWFMMPVRWYSAFANQALPDPLFVRLEGVLCAFALMGLLWLLLCRLANSAAPRPRLQTLFFALVGAGTLPLLLVMSRPEQPVLLALSSMILIALARPGNAFVTWLRVGSIVLLAGVAASYHLKGVVYAPIALVCIACCAKGGEALMPRMAGTGLLIAMMASAMGYWVGRFRCTGDPVLAKMYAEENLSAAISTGMSLPEAAVQALKGANPLHYVVLAVPSNEPMSAWIPADLFPQLVRPLFLGAMMSVWGVAMVLATILLGRFVWRERIRAITDKRAVLAATILACLLIWGGSQVNRNVYEASHVLPLLAVFVAMCLSLPGRMSPSQSRRFGWLVCFAAAVALASQVVILGFMTKPLLAAAQRAGPLPAQEFSVSIAGYDTVRADIPRAMALAGIDVGKRQRRLMIDEVTYLALQHHLLPLHRLGVIGVWRGSVQNPVQYLLHQDSAGVVAACANLSMEMESIAERSGEICAISPTQLKELALPPPALWEGG